MAKNKVPVTQRALIQRINRALDHEVVKVSRGMRARIDCGEFYAVDVSTNAISAKDIDLEKWGRDLEVLKPYEELAE